MHPITSPHRCTCRTSLSRFLGPPPYPCGSVVEDDLMYDPSREGSSSASTCCRYSLNASVPAEVGTRGMLLGFNRRDRGRKYTVIKILCTSSNVIAAYACSVSRAVARRWGYKCSLYGPQAYSLNDCSRE